MRHLLIICALFFTALNMNSQTISSIDRQGSWYYIYDQAGKKTHSLSTSQGELVGFSSQFFILKNGSWYYIYSADAKKERSLAVSTIGEILSVAGDTFTSRNGSWIYTWDRSGRKINSRAAR